MPEPHASLQRRLLESEGVTMKGRGIDMKRHGWSPIKGAKKTKGTKRMKPRAATARGRRARSGADSRWHPVYDRNFTRNQGLLP